MVNVRLTSLCFSVLPEHWNYGYPIVHNSYCMLLTILLFIIYIPGRYRVWIIGDSIIRWAGVTNLQLNGADETVWHGRGGARLETLYSRLHRLVQRTPQPTMLIIHLGTNDIFAEPLGVIRRRLLEGLTAVRNLLPETCIVWSDILPRLFYYGEQSRWAGNRVRYRVKK